MSFFLKVDREVGKLESFAQGKFSVSLDSAVEELLLPFVISCF